ncbi:M20/M25/M40 family metallo-hydrolase [Candidatus Dojkabacteria bacterium]|uniref:M20/M25/M40 family metallo-hydrolase n=1 Tax=Candidatus Dojkabacteria bacterium TaxID=2099670 RepID=A0A955L7R8_9BACT|nr:M20/M25/M40 family metallo-hydrolase [Candidatus Dojkabacteria bacterium]
MNNLDLLIQLVEQNSHSYSKAGVDAVGAIVESELPFMKTTRYRHESMGDLLVFTSEEQVEGEDKIILSGHSDTVFPPDTEFKVIQKGDKLHGPGTQDMKAGLVTIIRVLQKLHKEGKLKNITFTLIPDEEAGTKAHLDVLLNEVYPQFEIGLVFESSTEYNDNGAFLPMKRTLVTERKGGGLAFFDVTSKGGHAGVLTQRKDRISSVEEACYIALELEKLANYDEGTTLNPGKICGGIAGNVIAYECKLEADYRVVTVEEEQRIVNALNTIAETPYRDGTSTKLTLKFNRPPMVPTKRTPELVELAQNVANALNMEIVTEKRGGFSDGNDISSKGVTVLDGFGPHGNGEHSLDEFVYLSAIQPSIDYSYEFLTTLL